MMENTTLKNIARFHFIYSNYYGDYRLSLLRNNPNYCIISCENHLYRTTIETKYILQIIHNNHSAYYALLEAIDNYNHPIKAYKNKIVEAFLRFMLGPSYENKY